MDIRLLLNPSIIQHHQQQQQQQPKQYHHNNNPIHILSDEDEYEDVSTSSSTLSSSPEPHQHHQQQAQSQQQYQNHLISVQTYNKNHNNIPGKNIIFVDNSQKLQQLQQQTQQQSQQQSRQTSLQDMEWMEISEENENTNKNRKSPPIKKTKLPKSPKESKEKKNKKPDQDIREIKPATALLKEYFTNNKITDFNAEKIGAILKINHEKLKDILDIMECANLVTNNHSNNYVWLGLENPGFFKLIYNVYHSNANLVTKEPEFACSRCQDNSYRHQHPLTLPKDTRLGSTVCQFMKLLLSKRIRTNPSNEYLTIYQVCFNFNFCSEGKCPEEDFKYLRNTAKVKRCYDVANVFNGLNILEKIGKSKIHSYTWSGNFTVQDCESSCPFGHPLLNQPSSLPKPISPTLSSQNHHQYNNHHNHNSNNNNNHHNNNGYSSTLKSSTDSYQSGSSSSSGGSPSSLSALSSLSSSISSSGSSFSSPSSALSSLSSSPFIQGGQKINNNNNSSSSAAIAHYNSNNNQHQHQNNNQYIQHSGQYKYSP